MNLCLTITDTRTGREDRQRYYGYSRADVVRMVRAEGLNRKGVELWLMDDRTSTVLGCKEENSTRFWWRKK